MAALSARRFLFETHLFSSSSSSSAALSFFSSSSSSFSVRNLSSWSSRSSLRQSVRRKQASLSPPVSVTSVSSSSLSSSSSSSSLSRLSLSGKTASPSALALSSSSLQSFLFSPSQSSSLHSPWSRHKESLSPFSFSRNTIHPHTQSSSFFFLPSPSFSSSYTTAYLHSISHTSSSSFSPPSRFFSSSSSDSSKPRNPSPSSPSSSSPPPPSSPLPPSRHDPVAFFRRHSSSLFPSSKKKIGEQAALLRSSSFSKKLQGLQHNLKDLQTQISKRSSALRHQWRDLDKKDFLQRQRLKLRSQRQQVYLLMTKKQKVMQEKGLVWIDARRRKVEKALYQLEKHKEMEKVIAQGRKATERLRGLWERYGWASVLSYLIVHAGTFLSLFGIAQLISDESVQWVADKLHLDKIFDTQALANERNAFWGRVLFAYAACKPLTPVQVGLAIWLTPPLARFMKMRGIPLHVSRESVSHLRRRLRRLKRRSSSSSSSSKSFYSPRGGRENSNSTL
ncbi:transmembrane protein [Cystoisospora suis]|uniref:Transmembrane protein n=1 Tax=Cystoisospora suis TaxID=483139 RepID=A0A2C6KP91_9APIC|nr:transmembrane protein [Cystoisospora suis]